MYSVVVVVVVGRGTVVVVVGGRGGSVVTGVGRVVVEDVGVAACDAVHAVAMITTKTMSMRRRRDIEVTVPP
jgi:hypothetical protein